MVTISATGTWASTSVSTTGNLIFKNGITNNSVSFSAGGATFNTNNQVINGSTALSFSGIITATGIVLTNNNTITTTNAIAAAITGTGSWTQGINSVLNTTSISITLASMNASANGNLVNYNRNSAQTVFPATYYNLQIVNGNTKTLSGNTNALNNLTINATTLASSTFSLTVSGLTTISGNGNLSTTNIAGVFNLQNVILNSSRIVGTARGTVNLISLTTNSIANSIALCDFTNSGISTINGATTFSSNTGVNSFGGLVTISSSGTWVSTSANTTGNMIFKNGITNNGISFTAGGATFNTNNQEINGSTAFSFTGIIIVTGIALTNNNITTVTNTSTNGITGSGSWIQASSSILNTTTASINISVFDVDANPNLVNYNRGNTQTIFATTYHNLNVNATNTKTVGGNTIVNNDLNVSVATLATNNFTISVFGITTISSNGNLNTSNNAGIFNLQSLTLNSSRIAGTANGTVNATSLTTNGATNTIGTCKINISGTTQFNGSTTFSSATGTKSLTGAVTISSTGEYINNAGVIVTGSNSWINDGLFRSILGTTTIGILSNNSLINQSGSTINIQGGTVIIPGRLIITDATFTQSGGTINLTTAGNSSATEGNFEINSNSNLSISGGSIILRRANSAGFNSINIISGVGSKTITGGTFQFGDASTPAAQSFLINSPISLFNVTINSINTPLVRLVSNDLTLSGILTMNGGNIDGATNNLDVFIANGNSTAIVRTSGLINTNLKRTITSTGSAYLFPVGYSTNYMPANLTFTNLTAGDLNILAISGDEPDLAIGSLINDLKSVNSYWELSASNGLVSTNYSGTLTYPSSLNDDLLVVSNYMIGNNDGAWTYPSVSGIPTSTSLNFILADAFGNLAIGESKTIPLVYAGPNQSVCGINTLLDANTLTFPEIGTWSVISGSGGVFTDVNDPKTLFTGNGTYVLEWSVDYLGFITTDEVTIILTQNPTASAGTINASFVGDYYTENGATATNGTIIWTHNGNGFFDQIYFPINNETTLTPTYYVDELDFGNTVTLTMTVTGLEACIASTASATVTLNIDGNQGLWHYQCGTTTPFIDEYIYAYSIPGATQYRFKIDDGITSQTFDTPATVFYFRQFSSAKYNTVYDGQVDVFVGGIWQGFGPICQITTPVIPTTNVSASQCGITLATINTSIFADAVWGVSDYEFSVFDGLTTQTFQTTNRFFNLTQLASYSFGTTYSITVRTRTNGIWTAFGSPCNVSTPAQICQIDASQCGLILVDDNTDIYCNSIFGATIYEFRLVNGGTTLTIQKPSRTFKLSQVSGITGGTIYNVSVRTFTNGIWSSFGPSCTITSSNALTKIIASQCGVIITNVSTDLYADNVSGATQYRFRITNGGNIQTILKASRTFKLSQLPTVFYSAANIIDVDAFVNGAWIGYGATCSITTPSIPTSNIIASQCGITVASINTEIYADAVFGATQYRFRINGGFVATKSSRLFRLSEIPGLTINTIYSIDVAVFIDGAWQIYGPTCNVTSPAIMSISLNNEISEIQEEMNSIDFQNTENTIIEEINVVKKFDAVAFPNPFLSEFSMQFFSDSNEEILIEIKEVTGKILENFSIKTEELKSILLGEKYQTGIYYLIIKQGNNCKQLKIIKL